MVCFTLKLLQLRPLSDHTTSTQKCDKATATVNICLMLMPEDFCFLYVYSFIDFNIQLHSSNTLSRQHNSCTFSHIMVPSWNSVQSCLLVQQRYFGFAPHTVDIMKCWSRRSGGLQRAKPEGNYLTNCSSNWTIFVRDTN